MLGWHISVSRQSDGGALPATADSAREKPMAVWQARLAGTDWLDDLAARGSAVALGGNGYPNRYTARAADLIPTLLAGPPEAREVWKTDADDVVTPEWEGRTRIDRDALSACAPDEWLCVVAWDES